MNILWSAPIGNNDAAIDEIDGIGVDSEARDRAIPQPGPRARLMLYLVGGRPRSGTSMMMKALEAGGLEVARRPERDAELNKRFGSADWLPNEEYYELEGRDYRDRDFAARYDGKLVKMLGRGPESLPPGDYRIVVMRRDQEAIALSCVAAFGQVPNFLRRDDFQQRMDDMVARLRDRKSFAVDEVWYEDVIETPDRVFALLARVGWPIDPVRAAAVVDPSRCRMAA